MIQRATTTSRHHIAWQYWCIMTQKLLKYHFYWKKKTVMVSRQSTFPRSTHCPCEATKKKFVAFFFGQPDPQSIHHVVSSDNTEAKGQPSLFVLAVSCQHFRKTVFFYHQPCQLFLKALKAKAWLYNNRSCASWEIAETVKFQEKQWIGRRRKSFSFHHLGFFFFLFIFSDISGQSCCPLKTNYLQSVKIMANHTNVRFIKTETILKGEKKWNTEDHLSNEQ